ncbi:hypothetical protein EAI_04187, partial [Harpegnathos saltator]
CEIVSNQIIGPYSIDRILNSRKY